MQKLPPLSALRTFEAAARHLSFKAAADELCVTPSSVSHQIRKLEDWLDAALFVRLNREVALTQEGRLYQTVVAKAFASLVEGTSMISRRSEVPGARKKLMVAANSGFIDCWLAPRIDGFKKIAPNIDLQLFYGEDLSTYRYHDADLAIQHTTVAPTVPDATFLGRYYEFVVASPNLRILGKPLTELDELVEVPLFHELDYLSWKSWLDEFDVQGVDATSGPIFQNTQSIIARIEAREGVGLGDILVCGDKLLDGSLVRPLMQARLSDCSTYLLHLRRDRAATEIDIFSNWLIRSLKQHEEKMKALDTKKPYPPNWPQMN